MVTALATQQPGLWLSPLFWGVWAQESISPSRRILLLAAEAFNDLYTVRSLRLHALKGDRAGQHAIDVTSRVRLILTYQDDVRTIRVEEVSQHYRGLSRQLNTGQQCTASPMFRSR